MPGTGSVADTIKSLHERGYIPCNYFFPMLITSLVSITGGASAGPEASVLVMMAAVTSLIGYHMMGRLSVADRRILTICGMSAGLAGFFGLPLGGAIFVLETPHRMGLQYYEALSPAILSSLVSVIVNKQITGVELGGKFDYPSLGPIKGLTLLIAVALGVLGAIIAILFTYMVHGAKDLRAKLKLDKSPILLGIIGGILLGICGTFVPSSLFWGEEELQSALDRAATKLPNVIHPGFGGTKIPLDMKAYALMFIVKLFTITITLGANFPGGVIYPLFFVGASLGWLVSLLLGVEPLVCIMCLMGSIEASITRTPWATSIVIVQIQKRFSEPTHFIAIVPVAIVAIYTSLFITRRFKLYAADVQHSRKDTLIVDPRSGVTEYVHSSMRQSKSGI